MIVQDLVGGREICSYILHFFLLVSSPHSALSWTETDMIIVYTE